MFDKYKNNELVSIITPVYNAERFIEETIQSVQMQIYENWEMILVDDCSSDNSEKIILEMQKNDNRVKYIKLKENSGAAVARNTAIRNARGRYIAFLDSDDLWKPEKLDVQLKFMKENKYGFTFSSYEFISENGHNLNKVINVPEKINYKGLLRNTIIGCLTVIIDRSLIGDITIPHIRKGQDTATWLNILKNYPYAHGINENLAKYRLVEGSLSSNKLLALKKMWNIYRNQEKLSFSKSVYNSIMYIINAVRKRV